MFGNISLKRCEYDYLTVCSVYSEYNWEIGRAMFQAI